jgi:AcrR family transcriptional regulator
MPPVRPSSDEIDRRILDLTGGILAGRGIANTSVQAVADAAGYSKSGLLRRFPSKEDLVAAALAQYSAATRDVIARVAGLPYGGRRDAAALVALADLLFERPGFTRLLLAAVTLSPGDELYPHIEPAGRALFAMFMPEQDVLRDPDRAVRITSAISALAVVAMTHGRGIPTAVASGLVLRAAWDALAGDGPFPGRAPAAGPGAPRTSTGDA